MPIAVAVGAAAVVFVAGSALRGDDARRPAFLADKLGSSVATAPRETATGGRVELPRSGYELRDRGRRVAISSADETGSEWRPYERGAVRATPFGEETVVVDGEVVEQFLTVRERTGPKRWRWRLETGELRPALRPDGSVLVSAGNLVGGFRILPAAILDEEGGDVTPAGTRWQLERRGGGWWLALDLDDAKLPLPYVIDPATITLRAAQGNNNAGGATTLVITKPTGLAVDDQMIAQVTARGGTGTYICPPAGWTSVDRRNSGTALAQELFRKTATSADVAAGSFTFTLDNTAGCVSPTALKASGGVVAYYGVDNSNPVSAVNGQNNASSTNIAAPTVTPGANDVLLGLYGTATGTTVTAPTGSPTFTERWDTASTGGTAGTRTTSQLSTALSAGGATGTKTAVAANAAVNIGQLLSLRLDATAPTAPSVVLSESDADTHVSGTTLYYRAAGNGGSFDVTVTSTDGQSGLKHIAFPALAAGFTPTSTLNDTTSPYARTYSWSGGATESGSKTVTAEDNATNQSTGTFTITADNANPTGGALTVNGTAATGGGSSSTSSGSFSISRTDYTDGGSGLASSTLTRDSAPYNNDACGSYSGSPTTIVGTPAQNLTVGCYRYVLTGTDNVGNTVSLQTDVLVHGAAAQLALSGSTANLTSGATRGLTATVQDANGNTVLTDNSTVVSFTKQSGAGTVTGTGTATAASGVASRTVTGALAGSVTMQATASGLTPGTMSAFTVVHGAATQVALSGSTTDLASGTTRLLTATIQDAAGNTVTSDNSTVVTFSKQSGAGTVTGTGTGTAASGVATQTITGGLVGSVTMEATAGGLTTGALGAFTVIPGAPAALQLTGSTANLTSGSTRVLTATILDAAGNTVTGDNSTVVAFDKQSGAGTVTGTGTATAAGGVATKTVTGGLVGSVTMEATASGLTTGSMGAFTVVHGAAAQIALSGAVTDLASGASRVLTATIQDAAGNTVTSDNSTVVTFAKQGGAGTVSGSGTATAANGVATKSVTAVLAGALTLEATGGALTAGTLGFTVVHGAATQIQLSGSTADLASGANRALTATIQDAAGNTVTSDSSTVVSFTQAGGTGTVTAAGTATASAGVASKSVVGGLVGSVTMQAAAGGLTTGTLGAFTVVHGAAAQIVLSGSTADLTSGANRVLTATIQDAAGNTVTSDSSTVVAFGQASGLGSVTGLGNATAASGIATKTVTGALAGSVTMEATAGGLTTGTLGAFTVVHGAAVSVQLSGSTADLASGANRVLTATIRDAAGNTVTSDSATVVSFTQAGGGGSVTGTGNATASNGVATKAITGDLVGSVTMQASAGDLGTDTLGAFTVVHGAASRIQLTGATTDLASGTTRLLTATIQDAAGNTVTSDSSTVVAFAKASGLGSITGAGTATASSGVATKTVAGGLAGTVNLEATSAGLADGALTFVVVHGAATQIALTGSTANLSSGGNRVLTATVQDAAGNTVLSDNATVVTFAQAGGTGTVTGGGAETVVDGVALRAVTGGLVGTVTMQASAGGLATGTLGAFTVVHGAAAQIELTGATTDLASGANRLFTATIKDAAGNVVTGDSSTVVTFAKQSGLGTVTGLGTATAAGGVATKTVAGDTVGTVVLEASAAGLGGDTLSFVVVHGAAAAIQLTGSTTDLDSGTNRVLTATLVDAAGNTVTSDSATVVSFGQAAGGGSVTGTGNATASNGVATKAVTGGLVGSVTMEATASGLTTGSMGAFTVVHGAPAQIELSGSTADLASGANRVLTATLKDAAGNVVTGDSSTVVAFAQASGLGTVTGLGNATAASGVATKTVTGALAGTVNLEATSAGVTAGALSFVVVPGAAAQISLTGSTADLVSGANRVLTATLRDAAGNTATGDNSTVVTFAKTGGAGTVGGLGTATASSGVATQIVTGALAGSLTLEATAPGATADSIAFDVVHGTAAQIALTGSTADLASGASRVLTATVQDAAGNTVLSDSTTVVAFGQQSGLGSVTGLGNATAAGGVATKTVTGALAGAVVLEGTSAGLAGGTLGFAVAHGAAAALELTGSTADLASGTNRVLTARIVDAAGNTVDSDSSTVVTFAQTAGAGTVTGMGAATVASGVATKSVTGSLAGAVTLEASASGLTADGISFTVEHGVPAAIDLAGFTSNLPSGTNRILTATIRDAAGNTVTGDSSTVVTFAQQAGAGTVTGTGTATAVNGVATKTIAGGLAGSVTMESTAPGLTAGTLGAFTVVHGAAAQVALTGAITDLASGSNRVLTATVQDAAGNTVTNDNSTVVTFAQQSGAGTVSGAGAATAASGVATKTITGQLAGTVVVGATAPGLADGTLGAFAVVHGAAAQVDLSGATTDLASGTNRVLTATLRDAAGNVVSSDSSTVITFAKTAGAGTLGGLGAATAANGVATKSVTGALAGAVTVEASSGALTAGSLGFAVVHGAAAQIELTGATTDLASGANRVLTATIRDAAGNTVLSDSSTVVAFGKALGAGSVTGLGTATAAGGVATKTVTGALAGSVTMEATAAGLADGTLSFDVVHGAAAAISLAESGSLVAGDTHTLTATIRDAAGNTVLSDSSTVVAFGSTGGPGTVSGLGTATASSGVATRAVTNRLAGQVSLDAQAAGLTTGTTNYTIAVGPVSAAASDSTVVAAPTTVYADGSDTATITVTLRDAGGNPIAGKAVSLAQSDGSSTITGGGSTNAAGVVTFAVSNTTVELVTYTATDTTDAITLADDAAVDFMFNDATPPTNTVSLVSPSRAWLSGTTLWYNGAAGGSFSLSSAVADGGSGPASASYPSVGRPSWSHGAETVSAPAGGPYPSSAFTFAAGASGDFTYTVTAADAWSPANTSDTVLDVREDSTAPAAAIACDGGACPAGWSTSSPVSVTLAAPDAGAGLDLIRYTTDGTDPTIVTGTVYLGAFAVGAEGVTTVKYRAFDRVGNDTGVLSQTIRIDTVAPDTALDATPAAATQDTTPTFAFSSPDGVAFEARLDGGTWSAATSPLTLGPLAEGTYSFEVRATDAAGNVDASPASFLFTVDTTAADTTITSAPAAATNATGASFSFTASDAGPGFECRLDGGAWSACTNPETYSGLAEAAHVFEVRAKDAAGNVDPTPASHAWTVDLTAPQTSLLSTPTDPSANPSPTFSFASSEAPATFECNLDGGGFAPCATPFTTPALADGAHTLAVRASDAAGNTDASAASHAWVVDATAPTGSVTSPLDGAAVGGTVALGSDSADAGGTGVASITFQRSPATAGTWTNQASGWDTTLVADGDYDLRVVTVDNAGNSFTSPVVTVTVDNSEPSLSVSAPNPVNLATADPATIGATASDDGTGVANVRFDQCAEDSPACVSDSWVLLAVDTAAPYSASWPIPSDGPRLLRVRATDNAGKQRTKLVLVDVDRIRPAGSLTAPAAGANLRGAAVALAATASDTAPGTVNTVTFQVSPAGAGTWTDSGTDTTAPYTGTLDTTALADGLYDLRVFTTDAAGNAEAAPATIQVRVDNTLPTGSVTAPADGANLRGTVALASDSADTGSGVDTVQFQRSPAGAGSWTNVPASFDTTSVADGLHDLRVVTTDNAGNVRTSAAVTVRVDNTLPTGSVTAPADGAELGAAPVALASDSADTGSGVATVVFERSPAGAGAWTATPVSWDTVSGPHAVADGLYDLRVVTTDNADNVRASAAVTVLVDRTAPTTTASLAPGSPSNAPVTVGFTADDGSGSGVSVTSYRVDGGSLQSGAAVVVPAPGDHSNDGAHLVEFFSTDEVGNVEALQSVTVVIDTTAPSGSGGNPGDYLRGIANLSYSTAASDVSSVQFQFSPAGAGAWSNVGPADLAPPYEASWNTTAVADGPYDLRAVVTDTTGNVAYTLLPGLPKTVDNTAPSGAVTAPVAAALVSGTIGIDASATDGAVPPASGVSAVRFEVLPSGAGAYSVVGTQTTPVVGSTYRQALDTTSLADGPTDLRVVVTDVAGNETSSAVRTVTVDNDAPVVTLDDPGAAAGASVDLTASASADTTSVAFRYRPAGSAGAGTLIGTDTTAPFGVTWTTAPAAEGPWELIAVATDGGGNTGTSAARTIVVDRTQPAGSVTAPTVSATVGGPAVALAASASDGGGSGVVRVEFEVKPMGAPAFVTVATDTTAPYTGTWDSTSAPDGVAEIRAVVTDAAGNDRTTAVVPVTVDSTGPTVTLVHPGAVVSGTVGLVATTGGGAARVVFSVSPADAGSWTQIAEDTSVPFGADWDTAALADGLYDLRATGYDALGNASAPSLLEDVRVDNTAPTVVSSTPADGTTSVSANEIVLTASEPVTAVGVLLDGAAAPAPVSAGNQLTFPTGALADGLHVLEGELEDASGTRVRFRVAVTIVSAPTADPPPVERSVTAAGDWELTVPGGLVRVRMPQAAWPTPPSPADYILVLRVDAGPVPAGFAPGTRIVDVSARWARAGTYVTDFAAPLEIVFSNPTGVPVIPAHSQDASSWQSIAPLAGPLPAGRVDGFTRSGSDVHVWTRHLTYFGLQLDDGAPTAPRDLAGVVAADGLTLRWVPGTDASGQLGNVILSVNGAEYREFGPTEYEAKLGPFSAGDTRSFTLVQKDAAGNRSPATVALRAVPPLAGRTLADARAALSAAGFAVGTVREVTSATAVPGTIVEPTALALALAGTQVDLAVARSTTFPPETKLAFSVAAAKQLALSKTTKVAVRISLTKPSSVTAMLRDARKRRLHTWTLQARAGANVVELRLPAKARRPGTYTLTWVARAGSETVSRAVRFTLVGKTIAQAKPKPKQTEAVLAGRTPASRLAPGRRGMPARVLVVADADEAFETLSASTRLRTVVVVDADAFGTEFVEDVHAVFPAARVIAVSGTTATRRDAVKAGAVRALPRSTSAAVLRREIAAAAASAD